MGLDIFMKKVYPLEDDIIKDFTKDYDEKMLDELLSNFDNSKYCITYYYKEDFNKLSKNHPIRRYALKVNLDRAYLDKKKIANYFGYKRLKDYGCRFSYSSKKYTIFANSKKEEFDEISKFQRIEREYAYIFIWKEVAYQRGIKNLGWYYLDEIGNCVSFYGINTIKEMVFRGFLDEEFLTNLDEDCYFNAWW
jgi:hypothetical protein